MIKEDKNRTISLKKKELKFPKNSAKIEKTYSIKQYRKYCAKPRLDVPSIMSLAQRLINLPRSNIPYDTSS